MHPGPINRGVEISADVADDADTLIEQQVDSGLAVRMAILYRTIVGLHRRRSEEAPDGSARGTEPAARRPATW